MLIPAPFWVSYPSMVLLAGASPRIIPTREAHAFKLQAADLERSLTRRSKVLLLNTPHNPTGHVYSKAELERLARVIRKHRLLVITDEIYSGLTYGTPHISLVSVARELRERTILIDGVSKSYAMTGWRIGYAAGPPEAIKAMSAFQSQSTSNPTSISQYAALEALNGSQQARERMRRAFRARRNLVLKALAGCPRLSMGVPEGAFYVFINITKTGMTSQALAERLLNDSMVAMVPGAEFGMEGYLRLSYATSTPLLRQALHRLVQFFNR